MYSISCLISSPAPIEPCVDYRKLGHLPSRWSLLRFSHFCLKEECSISLVMVTKKPLGVATSYVQLSAACFHRSINLQVGLNRSYIRLHLAYQRSFQPLQTCATLIEVEGITLSAGDLFPLVMMSPLRFLDPPFLLSFSSPGSHELFPYLEELDFEALVFS